MKVDILLSTYNGVTFIDALLDSIMKQTYTNWRIVVRDDGSTDSTLKTLFAYQEKAEFRNRMLVINDEDHLGPCLSFGRLLEYASSQYIMFCDQDDVWLPSKIETTLNNMLALEQENAEIPILIHTDLIVVDRELQLINDSFCKYQNLNPYLNNLNTLLVQNNITGCTMMINQSLRMLGTPLSDKAIMHDWWIGLVAALFGKIKFVNEATILYRQHSKNNTGANKYSIKSYFNKIFRMRNQRMIIESIIIQTQALRDTYSNRITSKQMTVIEAVASILKKNIFGRIYSILRFKIHKTGIIRNIGLIIQVSLMKRY